MPQPSTQVSTETLIQNAGTANFKEQLKTYLNREVQQWQAIQDLCDSFANDISVERINSIEETDETIQADFTISFTDLQMAVCCEVQPGEAKSVSAKIVIDRNTAESSMKLGVFWDTDNDGY